MESIIRNLNIRPIEDLEEALKNLPPKHFCPYYNEVLESMLNLLKEVSDKKPCASDCDEKKLRIINLIYTASLIKSMQKTHIIFYPNDKIFSELLLQHTSYDKSLTAKFAGIIANRKDLPPSCDAYISELKEKIDPEIKKANYMVIGLALNCLHLFEEAFKSAKILRIYGGIKEDQRIKELAEDYSPVAEKCLDRLLKLPLPSTLKERIIPTHHKQIFRLVNYPSQQKYLSPP